MNQEQASLGAEPVNGEHSVFKRHRDITFACYGEEGLIVVPKDAWQLVVNPIGARVVELLDGKRSVGDIADQICSEFEATRSDVVADILELLGELQGKQAVELVG